MSTVDLRRYASHVIRKPNRPDPSPVMRCRPDVVVHHDSDTVSLEHLTRAQAERLYALALTDVHLFGLTYALGHMLGIDPEEAA